MRNPPRRAVHDKRRVYASGFSSRQAAQQYIREARDKGWKNAHVALTAVGTTGYSWGVVGDPRRGALDFHGSRNPRNPRKLIPSKWTSAKVRRGPRGGIQVKINPRACR